jgi:hypothetical protein
MKAAVTEKLLRSLLAKGASHEPIWDEIPPHLEWRINKRDITGSIVGRVRGSGTRQPIRLRAGLSDHAVAEIASVAKASAYLDSSIDPRAVKREHLLAEVPSARAVRCDRAIHSASCRRARQGDRACAFDAS